MLTNSKNGVLISVRDCKRCADVTFDRFSAFVDMGKKRVRGRDLDIRRIAEQITGRDEVSDVFSRKVVIKYVLNRVDPPAVDIHAVGEVLCLQPDYTKLDTLIEVLNPNDKPTVLQALRTLYKRHQCGYYRVDENTHYLKWGKN